MDHLSPRHFVVAVIALATFLFSYTLGANVVIQIPSDRVRNQDGIYRLDYWPPQGSPPPNSTFSPEEVVRGVELTRALPGTKYDFHLYYSNDTIDWLTWTASITTVPLPPSNLSIVVRSGKVVQVTWEAPTTGGHSRFKLKVKPLSEPEASVRNVVITEGQLPFNLRELTPGASYELQLYTIYEGKESAAYISSNFTTRPNAPGRFIVWYRNQTTMLVLWQPPYPPGIYSHYKVSIDPPDSVESELWVEKGGDPPGPAQAAFHGLVSGRAYNITVETISEDQVSVPTTAPYRTIPLRPENVTFDYGNLKSDSFTVLWQAPKGFGEFDHYQLSLGVEKQTPVRVLVHEPRRATFNNLRPGQTYTVLVKTVAGNVPSWPCSKNITTRPLKVSYFDINVNQDTSDVTLSWLPNPDSKQDKYKIVFQEVETFNGDSRTSMTEATSLHADLYPGRNYSVSVYALSNGIESLPLNKYILTKPASLIIEELQPIQRGFNVSWKSDVTSKQARYAVIYTRNDTGEQVTQNTSDPHIVLENLYPGAGYEIKVYAISQAELFSEPHVHFKAVYPNPVRNLTIVESYNSTVKLEWLYPVESLFSHYVCRYRTLDDDTWFTLPPIKESRVSINNLLPGERYLIEVRAVSYKVESLIPLEVHHTVPPSPVRNLERRLDSQNITFEWPRPEGRIDYYVVMCWNADTPEEKKQCKKVSGDKATEGITRKVSILIDDLMPGELYNFEIFTVAHKIQSEKVTAAERTIPIITSDLTIVNRADDTQSFAIRYTPTPLDVSTFDLYRFVLSDPTIPVKEKPAQDVDRKVVFDNLVPGRQYNITAWTVSGGVTSHPLVRQIRLFPEPAKSINATAISDTNITLAWKIPAGDYDGFKVTYIASEDRLIENEIEQDTITVEKLRPNRNYTFTIVTLSGIKQSKPISKIFTTRKSPWKVRDFEWNVLTPRSIQFQWDLPPDEENGVIIRYIITYFMKENETKSKEYYFDPMKRRGIIENLIPGETYIFKIQAETRTGRERIQILEQKMPIEAPPPTPPDAVPIEVSKSSETITIAFEKDHFSNLNGKITNYSVIVSESRDIAPGTHNIKTWADFQKGITWPAYQVFIPSLDLEDNNSIKQFTLGTDKDCEYRHDFCNGPLKPGTQYWVKIRAYTSKDKFTDTAYSEKIVTEYEKVNLGIALGIPAVFIILIVVAFFVFTRRRVGPFLKRASEQRHRDDVHSLSDSIIETSRPVKLRDFVEHYRFMSADSDFRFSEEYEALKNVGRSLPCLAADLPVNRPKNRFTNILPFDHSRVKLQQTDDEEGTDYVNANYVPGFNSPREFVVTQGPLASTRDDYWRMVWETNSRAIIMLTRCIEKGREKCDHYWPYDTKAVYYGDISVTILNESHYPDWAISEFRVCKDDVCRIIRHFHFTTWPDFGVPDPPQTLVRFVRAFRERVGPDQKPIVVHCSAGVGRSGTFIALDRILQSIRVCDYVDIFGIVYEMRRERVWMVQNEQQYICIHQCLLSVLEGKENEHIPKEIHDNQGFEDDEGIAESGM